MKSAVTRAAFQERPVFSAVALFESMGCAGAGLLCDVGDQAPAVAFNGRDDAPPGRQFRLVGARDDGYLVRKYGAEREQRVRSEVARRRGGTASHRWD
jgi:hypothetical protein